MRLKSAFYLTSLLLIVAPMLVIAVVSIVAVHHHLMTEANTSVDTLHARMAETLREEVRGASLTLSGFLVNNDGEALLLASDREEQRYERTARLQSLLGSYALRSGNLQAVHLYMNNGDCYELIAGLSVPAQEVRQSALYTAAREKPNQVRIGSLSEDILQFPVRRHGRVLLAAALSPQQPLVPVHDMDVAMLLFTTDVEKHIADANEGSAAVRTFLLDGGHPLVGAAEAMAAAERFITTGGKESGDYDWAVETTIPGTSLTLLTLVDNQLLLLPFYRALTVMLLTICLLMTLYAICSRLFLRAIVKPLGQLHEGLEGWGRGDFSRRLTPCGHRELRAIMCFFNDTADSMEALIRENRRQEQEKYQEELKALQHEINPHFLLNTVNTIRFMADMAKFDAIRDMASWLMEIMRGILRNPSEQYTLITERQTLEAYVRIMEIRKAADFHVDYDLAEDTLDCRLPKLLLQPLVENAIQHGFAEQEAPGVIRVVSRLSGDLLRVTVSDNGSGIPPRRLAELDKPAPEGSSIGLSNVRRRLMLLDARRAAMTIESRPGQGTAITLTLPAVHPDPEENA